MFREELFISGVCSGKFGRGDLIQSFKSRALEKAAIPMPRNYPLHTCPVGVKVSQLLLELNTGRENSNLTHSRT